MPERVDVVVIGMGPGGEAVAGELAEAGLSVVGVESHLVGGECPYYGCIPSKMMIRAANSLAEARRVPDLAGASQVSPDYAPVARRIRERATDNWNDQVAVDRFTGKGGRFVRGIGRITGPGTVRVGEEEFAADRAIVINAGTEPAIPPVPGLAGAPLWTNREAVRAATVPESLIVLGGGAIGLELAQVFTRFGSAVTVVELADRILPLEEPEASQVLTEVLTTEGLTLHTGAPADQVSHDGSGFTGRGGVTSRVVPLASPRLRACLASAEDHAAADGGGEIGTQHLLAGLLTEGVAAAILERVGVTAVAIQASSSRLFGTPQSGSTALDLSEEAACALDAATEQAARQQVRCDDPFVGTEHLLSILVLGTGCRARRVLNELDISSADIKRELDGYVTPSLRARLTRRRRNPAEPACSFCRRPRNRVGRLVAGPGVWICGSCTQLAADAHGSGESTRTGS